MDFPRSSHKYACFFSAGLYCKFYLYCGLVVSWCFWCFMSVVLSFLLLACAISERAWGEIDSWKYMLGELGIKKPAGSTATQGLLLWGWNESHWACTLTICLFWPTGAGQELCRSLNLFPPDYSCLYSAFHLLIADSFHHWECSKDKK